MFRRFLKKQTKNISKWAIFSLFFICFVLVISFGINIVTAVWHEPTATPAGDNIFGFLNIGPDNQAKKGKLRLGSSDLTNFTYSLEVKGEAEMNELIVNGQGKFGETLYINPQVGQLGQVGIGTPAPTTTLEVSGGGVTVGKATPIPDKAIEGYSSGDTAIYGEALGSGEYYGVRGMNDSYYGVWGVSDSGRGVYGKSTDASGVMGVTYSEKYGIYGCNGWDSESGSCSPNLLTWAGYFSGRVIADNNDVIGTRFLPEKLQASLIPFTQAQTMSLKSDLKLYYPVDLAFDGEYLWTIRDGWYGYVSKVRPADGIKTDYQFSAGIGCNGPTRIIYAGGYIWVTCNGTHRIVKINPNDGTQQTAYATKSGSVDCTATGEDQETYYQGCSPYALIYDDKTTPGEPYIWTTNYRDPDAYPDPDERYYDDIPGTSSVSRIKADGSSLDVFLLQNSGDVQDTNPRGIALDDITAGGPYIWTANAGSYPSGFSLPADSISQMKTDGTFIGTYSIDDNPNDSIHQKPVDIVFDGTNLWTANNGFGGEDCWDWRNGGCPNVAKIDPVSPANINYYMAYGRGTQRLLLDNITTGGPYIWAAQDSVLTRMDLNGNLLRKSCGSPPCEPKYSSIRDPGGLVTTQPITEGANQYTNIWVTDTGKFRLAKIKSSDNTIDKTFLLGGSTVTDSTFDGSYIWTADVSNDSISKIRAADGQKIAEYTTITNPNAEIGGQRPYLILSDGENIWVVHHNWGASSISKFKASDGTPLDPKAEVLAWTGSPNGLVLDNTSGTSYLWILLSGYGTGSSQESKLIKYKISNNVIENTYSLGLNLPSIQGNPQKPQAMTFDGKYLWIANYYDDSCEDNKCGNGAACNNDADCDIYNLSSIMRIDPADPVNSRRTEDLPAGYQPQDIIFDGKYLWTANYGNGSVSKWFITGNPDDPLTKIADYLIDNAAKPSKLAFDGTYIWVAEDVRTDSTNHLTVLRASDGGILKTFQYDQYASLNGLMFDGDDIWLASNGCGSTRNTLYKYYSGAGYGQQNIEQVVRLQNIVPGYTDGEGSDFKHFNVSGSGTVGADAVVGANVSVTNNVWGGSSDTEVPISGAGIYNCPDGYFVKDIQSGASTSSFGIGGVITGDNATRDPPGMAINASYMFVVGSDDSAVWRIEKRLLSNGALDTGFGTNGVVTDTSDSSAAKDIVLDSTYMYIIGYDNNFDWRIEKRQLSDGALDTGFGTNGVITVVAGYYDLGISIDSNYMYLVGANDGNDWRMEKRQLSNGALDTGFGTNGVIIGPSTTIDAHDIAIDSTYMFVVGQEGVGNWRIEKRLLSNGSLDNSFGVNGVVSGASLSWYAANIAINSAYMYVVGFNDNEDWRIEKRQLSDGALDTGFGTNGVVTGASITVENTDIAIAIDSSYMYVAGFDENDNWRIEKRLLSNGSLDNSFGTNGVVTGAGLQGSYDGMAISIDSTYMYVSGNNNDDWRIEKRQLSNGVLDNLPTNAITKLLCRPL